ncbi:hypothetical protein HBI56_179850 [Parastagonospora nodorum]|uniref:Uncharacterized protein n=2 Tax=Phaeosphaeria nodorum (strain SN15 / ATCC MYA-4574 / FGSC 10173) TaxID=321614 RepID=Q0TYM3_PHANO|nr:hypothetical protein SNOG_15288 [Parastagonospora nodorum SN15]KAH3907605.1 hypothetical protein HBH56_185280 [Parastagonospora nodorum]EAT77221.1 hypothetical protein SNOG_15288 [Parastagonospora nodorum SN15]KAH3925432.1 hypothetical protein HBH54_183290 [Parastagonospora nodorum]KAH3940603.1 hypothetical protein HBH53_214850 [Parastagonospora nodorum]KAH3962184.1 hypothetical protein HBH52_225730 [Parastagonospora nodorum]
MSGIEVASLVLGIVPVVVEVLKSYRSARDRFNTFRHYSDVVDGVRLSYATAAASFKNDCQLLLQCVLQDAREISQMVEDPRHGAWHTPELEGRFRNYLGADYEIFELMITEIKRILRETGEGLRDLPVEDTKKRTSQHDTKQRLYLAFNISRKENRYRRWLQQLHDRNTQFGDLNKQRRKLQKRHTAQSGCIVRKAVPRKYGCVQTASQRLHESLNDSWSCKNGMHCGHEAKLCLEAKADYGSVRLDMVIAGRIKPTAQSHAHSDMETPLWLFVEALTTTGAVAKPIETITGVTSALLPTTNTALSTIDSSNSESFGGNIKRKYQQSVRFDTSVNQGRAPAKTTGNKTLRSSGPPGDPKLQSLLMVDLMKTDSICCHLKKYSTPAPTCVDSCLGYLEHQKAIDTCRFVFYDAIRDVKHPKVMLGAVGDTVQIVTMMSNLRTLHQLTLAHQLATATLQYRSTFWLAADWSLQDIAYFAGSAQAMPGSCGQDTSDRLLEQLRSLHLSTQFPNKDLSKKFHATGESEADLAISCGIRNLPLANLGIALLEIGCQAEIKTLAALSAPHNIIRARKVLQTPPPAIAHLGKRYQRIIQQCIDCDFSCGNDLDSEELQSAVYTDVVCELESLVMGLKRFLGIE